MSAPRNRIEIPASKAARTRAHILDIAQREASLGGLDSLTLGGLAAKCGMSKSGLNAHFGAKEPLQLAVIDAIAARFLHEVAQPAFATPPGAGQLLAIMAHWIAWSQHPDRPGGCQLIAAAYDFDGLDGAVRDRLAAWIGEWRGAIAGAVAAANRADGAGRNPDQLTSLAYGIYMTQHMERFLLGDHLAAERAAQIWRQTIDTPGGET